VVRDDPFEIVSADLGEERAASACDVLGIQHGTRAPRHDRPQQALPIGECEPTDVVAVQDEHVERDEGERTSAAHEIIKLRPALLSASAIWSTSPRSVRSRSLGRCSPHPEQNEVEIAELHVVQVQTSATFIVARKRFVGEACGDAGTPL
jgi:hypothetical protein